MSTIFAQDKFEAFCPDQKSIETAIGCVPITSISEFATFLLRWGLGVGGGIAILMIIYGGYQVMASNGDPKLKQSGQELITSAVAGLMMMIFSIFILRVLGVTILGLF